MQRGTRLGAYELVEQLGEGGMGVVWRATDMRLGRDVAVKILPPLLASREDALARFEREARGLGALSHPNIVAIYDVGHAEGLHYLVTELLHGETLRDRIRRGAVPWRDAVAICASAADALAAAHAKGIVHRDLKPENIFISGEGHVKLLDFGLAKDVVEAGEDAATEELKTEPGIVLGTPGYIAPEQLRGRTVSPAADIFALGCVLHELLAGKAAFRRGTSMDTIAAILTEDPTPFPWPADAPAELRPILDRCLEKRVEARTPSARELANELRALTTTSAQSPVTAPRMPRRLMVIGAIALLAMILVLVLAVPRATTRPPASPSGTGASTNSHVVAIVPFTADAQSTWAADGFVEGVRRRLATTSGLDIVTRGMTDFDGSDGAHVLTGSIRTAGTDLRVDASLRSGSGGAVLWSRSYETEGNLGEIERKLAIDVDEALHTLPSFRSQARPTRTSGHEPSSDAYREYLKGRHYWNKFNPAARLKALEHYKLAIEADPTYPLAWCGMADTYLMMAFYGEHAAENFPKAGFAARRAIELDPLLGEGYTSLGTVLYLHEWKWAEAERALRRGVELSPRYATAHHSLAVLLGLVGQFDEAQRRIDKAIELDPLSVVIRVDQAWVFMLRGENPRAIEALQAAIREDPDSILAWAELSWHLDFEGRHAEALDAFARSCELQGIDPALVDPMRAALKERGERGYLEARLAIEETIEGSSVAIARTCLRLGDTECALELLEKARNEHEPLVVYVGASPAWSALRDEPRFQAIVRSIGLPSSPAPTGGASP